MQGRGRALLSLAFALLLAFGCGGRTDALYGEDGDDFPVSGSGAGGASAGQPGRAGASSRSGAPGVGGVSFGGGASMGGTHRGGHGGVATAGAPHTAGVGGVHTAGAGGIASGGEGGAEPQECVSCLRESCTDELVQCFSDSGCFAIFRCVGLAGCTGLDCYTPQKCKKVIDQFGGPTGPSMQAVLGTLTCAVSSGCQCQ